jgi:hypothetical protein
MKKSLLSLVLCAVGALCSFAQTVNPQTAFDKAYWAAQPPEVVALLKVPDQTQRASQAMTLAIQGFTIDNPIDVWGWDPYQVMQLRQDYGYTWVPSYLQPAIQEVPGKNLPGLTPYDPAHPPAGSIKVSLNLADYPPFTPPAAPVVNPSLSFVGNYSYTNAAGIQVYTVGANDKTPNGGVVKEDRGTFIKHVVPGPFGKYQWYEKQ